MFTPNEQRIMNLLADGERHPVEEVLQCLDDPMAQRPALRVAIVRLRKKLHPGELILCEVRNRRAFYRRARHLVNPYDGRR